MPGGEVIYPGPARIVLAAAQLRDPDLTERYSEEWLANLHGRACRQQWRDAVSLLLRGARATRWAHHGTHDSRPRLVVASQVAMALVVATGTVLLLATSTGWGMVPWWRAPDLLTLYAWLTAAGTTGLVLLTRRSWRAVLHWLAIGFFGTIFGIRYVYSFWYLTGSARSDFALAFFFYHWAWWVHIAIWWAPYAALTLFVHRRPFPVMRALAAVDVVASARFITPDWVYEYADRLGLVDLIRLMAGLLNVDKSTALQVTPGIVFLLGTLIAVVAWRCVVIAKPLILPARCGPSGARVCPR